MSEYKPQMMRGGNVVNAKIYSQFEQAHDFHIGDNFTSSPGESEASSSSQLGSTTNIIGNKISKSQFASDHPTMNIRSFRDAPPQTMTSSTTMAEHSPIIFFVLICIMWIYFRPHAPL